MKAPSRIEALQDTCQRVVDIAGLLQQQGVCLRFLNYHYDQYFNLLDNREVIGRRIKEVEYTAKPAKRPVITDIIKDGCPLGEATTSFEQAVLDCKRSLGELHFNFKPASAVLLISRVDDDPQGRDNYEWSQEEQGPRGDAVLLSRPAGCAARCVR
ncbi:hypothetical protein BDV23DRAFT_72606 [Aspergillus alliaceus]|uniref:Uncharacterized protein n=1 Tax=Petromyces alliaceus TaxID=209559 RepID=A0A5N7CAN5_PETAA|nr:hypothetical protein BDV23DRAFT_72606 [Aspergillus alliaceus]